MSEWVRCTLGDLITFQRGYDLPKNKMQEGIFPVVGSNGIIGFHNTYTTDEPSITIGRSGNVGKPFVYYGKTWSHNTTLYVKDYKGNDSIFVFYLLKSLDLGSYAGGSAVPTLNRNHIHDIDIVVPNSVEEQRKIGVFLKKIDDKIELNNSLNNNLEQQVSNIYQSWFENSDVINGILPENWNYVEFSTIANIASGKRPPNKAKFCDLENPIPIVGASSIMGFTSKTNQTNKILIIGRVGTLGAVQRVNTPCWASDNTLIIASKYYEFTNQLLRRFDYSSINRGSTQPLITQSDVKKLVILLPDNNTLLEFEGITAQLMKRWEANNLENERLISLRNILLPKLLSGELDISNIEI